MLQVSETYIKQQLEYHKLQVAVLEKMLNNNGAGVVSTSPADFKTAKKPVEASQVNKFKDRRTKRFTKTNS